MSEFAVESITLAELVLHRGEVVHEQYAPSAGPDTTPISWLSTAKSVTHALVGIAVRDGPLDLDAPAQVAEWSDDGRSAITLRQLLHMCSGLRFVEDYVDDSISHCIDMLFGAGQADVADTRPPCRSTIHLVLLQLLVGHDEHRQPDRRAGRGRGRGRDARSCRTNCSDCSASRRPIPASTPPAPFIGSSFLYCTVADFARFGELYLADGVWDGRRLLPDVVVDFGLIPAPVPVEEEFGYGAHWWLGRARLPWDVRRAHGYEGQYIIVRPDRDLVVVRLGKTPIEVRLPVIEHLQELLDQPW